MQIISVMRSWIFIIITPVFSVTWSSEIILIYWFAAKETFLIIIKVENSCTARTFCKQIPFYVAKKKVNHMSLVQYVTLEHKTSLKSLGYICSNRQQYTV